MAPGWEMGLGMDMGFGMGASATAATAPLPPYLYGLPSVDTLRIDDLLDLSNANNMFSTSAATVTDAHVYPPTSAELSSTINAESSSSLHFHPNVNSSFADDLYIPSEEAAELEWLSKFVDDSFSDVPSSCNILTPSLNTLTRGTEPSVVPGRGVRSKRSRSIPGAMAAAAAAWSSLTSPPLSSSSTTSSSSSSEFPTTEATATAGCASKTNSNKSTSSTSHNNKGKKSSGGAEGIGVENGVRRCTHCASEKTPQWRTGPLGPKTLCNACGVRYKSGRLVPEYRPAASPTFVLTQHSNSHRKVLELRRQKEMLLISQQHNSSPSSAVAASAARPDQLLRDYEVC